MAIPYARSIWSIIYFEPEIILNDRPVSFGEFTLEAKVGEMFKDGLLGPNWQILDESGKAVDTKSNLFLLFVRSGAIRAIETHVIADTPKNGSIPSSFKFFPMSALYLELANFMDLLKKRMAESGFYSDFKLLNEYNIEVSESNASISQFLRETHSSRLQIRLCNSQTSKSAQEKLVFTNETSNFASKSPQALSHAPPSDCEIPLFSHTSGARKSPHNQQPQGNPSKDNPSQGKSPQDTGEDIFAKSKSVSIEMREGLKLTLSKRLVGLSPSGMLLSSEVREALQEFLNSTFSRKLSAESSRSFNPEFQAAARRLRSEGVNIEALETLDESIKNMLLKVIKQNSSLRQENTALKARVTFTTQLAQGFRRWEGRVARALRAGFVLAQRDIVMVALYSFFWMVLIHLIGKDMLVIQLAIGLYLGVNVSIALMRTRYGIDVMEAIVEHTLPKLYPADPVARITKERLENIASLLRGEGDVDYNGLLDSLIQRPSFGKIIGISVFAVVPSVLDKWHKAIDKQRQEAKAAIMAAAEDLNAKRNAINDDTAPPILTSNE